MKITTKTQNLLITGIIVLSSLLNCKDHAKDMQATVESYASYLVMEDYDAINKLFTSDFQESVKISQLKDFHKKSGLGKKSVIGNYEVNAGQKKVFASVNGKAIAFFLYKENDNWKIDTIIHNDAYYIDPRGLHNLKDEQKTLSQAATPEDDEKALVDEVMKNFTKAIQKKDFTDFMTTTSSNMQKQISVAEMNKQFSDIFPHAGKVTEVINNAKPEITSNEPVEGGIGKRIKGKYTGKGMVINFNLLFMDDLGSWKLLGINIKN